VTSGGRLPTLTPRKVLQALEGIGFVRVRASGSHHIYEHPDRPGRIVPVPVHARDLKRPMLKQIIKQAGLTEEEFLKLL
jgi:predicted RNA binding protein YcfA (HicA-like mRNA interferase family)